MTPRLSSFSTCCTREVRIRNVIGARSKTWMRSIPLPLTARLTFVRQSAVTHPARRPHHPFKTLSNCPAAPIWAMHHGEANFAHPDPNFRDGQLGSPLTQKDASIDGQRLRLCLQLDISILFCRFPVKVDMPRRKYASDESTVNAVTLPVYKLRPYHAVLTQRPCDCPVQFVMMASDNPCFLVVNGFSNVLDKI